MIKNATKATVMFKKCKKIWLFQKIVVLSRLK